MQELLHAFGIDWRLLLAQAINFAIVLVALRYFLYKPVTSILEKRRQIVAKGVEDAREAEEILGKADSEASKRVLEADEEAEKIVSNARVAAHKEQERLLKDAEARAVSITSDAEIRAEEIAARAVRENEHQIAKLAILAAEKILKKQND